MGGGSVGGGLNPTARTLGTIIAGPESSGDYGVMYSPDPKNRRTFNDFSHHPNQAAPIPGTSDVSAAAGAYQFTHPTWTHAAQIAGVNDFTPASQDKAMWAYAQEMVPNLQGILESGDPRQIEAAMTKLGETWKGIKDPRAATREYLTRRGQTQASAPQGQAPQDSRYLNTTGADNGFGYTGDQMLLDPRMERMLVGSGLGSANQTFRGLAMGNNEALTRENIQQAGANTRQGMSDNTRLQAEYIQQAGADRRDANNPVSVGENSTVYLPSGHFASGGTPTDASGRHYIQGPGVGPDGARKDNATWVYDRQSGGERMVPQSEIMGNPNRYTHQQPGLLSEKDPDLANRISPTLGSDAGEIPPQVTQAIRTYAQGLYDAGQAHSPDEAYSMATQEFTRRYHMRNDFGQDSVQTADGKAVDLGTLGSGFAFQRPQYPSPSQGQPQPQALMAPGSLAPPPQNQPAPPVQRPAAGNAPAPSAQAPQVPQGAALMEARQALARVAKTGGDAAQARAVINQRLQAAGIDPRLLDQ
jgi:muramidase (phage lysozyme)